MAPALLNTSDWYTGSSNYPPTASTYVNNTYVNNVWSVWHTATTSSTASYTTDVWVNWTTVTPVYSLDAPAQPQVRPPTPEQVRLAQEREAAARIARVARKKTQDEAVERSYDLLRDLLDEEQREMFDRDGYFHVYTRDGVRKYRLHKDRAPALVESENGGRYSFCIHPTSHYPRGDVIAAHKLLLETDEERFLAIANASRL